MITTIWEGNHPFRFIVAGLKFFFNSKNKQHKKKKNEDTMSIPHNLSIAVNLSSNSLQQFQIQFFMSKHKDWK